MFAPNETNDCIFTLRMNDHQETWWILNITCFHLFKFNHVEGGKRWDNIFHTEQSLKPPWAMAINTNHSHKGSHLTQGLADSCNCTVWLWRKSCPEYPQKFTLKYKGFSGKNCRWNTFSWVWGEKHSETELKMLTASYHLSHTHSQTSIQGLLEVMTWPLSFFVFTECVDKCKESKGFFKPLFQACTV